jgi:hypothetical protein
MKTRKWILAVLAVPVLTAGIAFAQSSSSEQSVASEAQMAQHMQRMQALHAQLQRVGSPDEKQRVMGELRQEMRTGMTLMHDNASGDMQMSEECQQMMKSGGMGMHGGGRMMPGMGTGGTKP